MVDAWTQTSPRNSTEDLRKDESVSTQNAAARGVDSSLGVSPTRVKQGGADATADDLELNFTLKKVDPSKEPVLDPDMTAKERMQAMNIINQYIKETTQQLKDRVEEKRPSPYNQFFFDMRNASKQGSPSREQRQHLRQSSGAVESQRQAHSFSESPQKQRRLA